MKSLRPLCLFLALSAIGCATTRSAAVTEAKAPSLRWQLAKAYVDNRAYGAALPLLQRAVEEQPTVPEVRTVYASVLREQGLYPQAEEQFRKVLATTPQYAPAHSGLAVLFNLMRRSDEALDSHEQAVSLDPSNASAWNNLGFALSLRGQNDRAILSYERALSLDPTMRIAYNNLGFAYARRGDMRGAARCFRAAVGEAGSSVNLALARDRQRVESPMKSHRRLRRSRVAPKG